MKALVTGGAGFIGSHLVERLLNDGNDVVVIDNLSGGTFANLDSVAANPQLEFVTLDVANSTNIATYFDGVHVVFHLAGLADIVSSITDPSKYHQVNVDGTVAVLEAARDKRVSKFVYAASSSCYGLPDEFPTPESAPIRPMYPYALSKNLGEQCVLHWNKVYGLPSISLRLFNVFGPRARTSGAYGAVFGTFLAQKLAGKPFTIVGDGAQTRDFTFVTDVIEAFVRSANCNIDNEIFNVGSGGTYSINYLASLLGGEVIHLPKRPGEPDCTLADISKIGQALNWRPEVTFEKGVEVVLKNIEHWRDAPVWEEESISKATHDWFRFLGHHSSSAAE